jgi:hypothetical protein
MSEVTFNVILPYWYDGVWGSVSFDPQPTAVDWTGCVDAGYMLGRVTYPTGTTVTLTGVEFEGGRRFMGFWGKIFSKTKSITFTVDETWQDAYVYLVFKAGSFTLEISIQGSGITDPPPGKTTHDWGTAIAPGNPKAALSRDFEDDVTVTATASAHWKFSHWILNGETKTENPITLKIDADYTLTAVFTPITHTLTITATIGGTTNPPPGTYTIQEGETIQITAIPAFGYTFKNFIVDNKTISQNPITLTIDKDYTITATFKSTITTLTIATIIAATATIAYLLWKKFR